MGIDYSRKMNDLIFSYDEDFYPLDADIPDPQVDPIIPGAHVPIQKVGIAPVDMPIYVKRKGSGLDEKLLAQASLYCSLDDPHAKGLNLSRFYLLMQERMAEKDALGSMQDVLQEMAKKQGSNNAYVKLRFKYPWQQTALRTRDIMIKPEDKSGTNAYLHKSDKGRTLSDGTWISHKKKQGHIAYDIEFEGQWHHKKPGLHVDYGPEFKYYLTVDYIYSSTCPCSFELAHDAKSKRKAAANAHSQRSRARVKIEFDPDKIVWIEDIIELCRKHIPTEVQVIVKRRDEQAFAELNGSNMLFSEDVCRILYGALDEFDLVKDFCVVVEHFESLHPWNAVGVIYKGIEGGLH
jgi:GTP cyclohydrolase I